CKQRANAGKSTALIEPWEAYTSPQRERYEKSSGIKAISSASICLLHITNCFSCSSFLTR
ncbi:hypothetical protein, partial [Turicimonas muris]|uniref:hypothetical protein n=1 Tax=Turicimonas muris TaxID=1796652 RepID=UPI0023F0C048